MGTDALAEVPNTNHAGVVSTDQLTLVWMNDNIIDWCLMDIVALQATGPSIPDLHSSIFGAGDHPLALAVECDTCNVVRVALKGNNRARIGRLDVKKLHVVVASGCQESLIRGDAKSIDLRIGVLDSTRANAGERLPKAIKDTSAWLSMEDTGKEKQEQDNRVCLLYTSPSPRD